VNERLEAFRVVDFTKNQSHLLNQKSFNNKEIVENVKRGKGNYSLFASAKNSNMKERIALVRKGGREGTWQKVKIFKIKGEKRLDRFLSKGDSFLTRQVTRTPEVGPGRNASRGLP